MHSDEDALRLMSTTLPRAEARAPAPRWSPRPAHALAFVLILILGWLTFVPVLRLVIGSLTTATGTFTLENYMRVYSSPVTYELLVNSLIFAVGSCLLSFSIGTSLAWIIERTDTPGRRFFYTVAL